MRVPEIDFHRFDVLGGALLYIQYACRTRRQAEYAEVLDIHRLAAVEGCYHGLHKIGQYTLDVSQCQRTLLFHHIRNVVQRRIVAQCHQLRVELCHRICLSRIFPRNLLEWYSHKQLNN